MITAHYKHILRHFYLVLSVSYMRAYLINERILYDEKIFCSVSYMRAYLVSERIL